MADIMGYLAQRPDELTRFFQLTGLTPHALREATTMPGFAADLLEHVCSDERLLRAFAMETGHDPAQVDMTRQSLAPHITGESG